MRRRLTLTGIVAGRRCHLESESDVGVRAPVVEEPEILEDNAEPPSQLRDVTALEGRRIGPADADLATGRAFFHVDELEQRALAGAARAGEKEKLALGYVQGGIVERTPGARIFFRDVGESDHRNA